MVKIERAIIIGASAGGGHSGAVACGRRFGAAGRAAAANGLFVVLLLAAPFVELFA